MRKAIISRSRKAAPAKPQTLQQWAESYCSERGFSWEFAQRCSVELADDAGARRAKYPARGGIIFHAYDPITGKANNSGQIRHQHPPIFNGKERKFSNRNGSAAEPYFASNIDWKPIFKNPKIPIVITEGPTRSIAGAAHGFNVIALRGVECQGIGDELHPILLQVKWKGRRVAIAFDSDAGGNPNVQRAEQKLAAKLIGLGAQVSIVRIPPVKPKAGLDDLLALEGGAKLFQQLWDNAKPIGDAKGSGSKPEIIRADEVKDEKTEWLWHRRVPFKMLSSIEGKPCLGKSWIALNIAAEGSQGREAYTQEPCAKFNTVYMSIEMRPATIMRRYRAMGGDLKRLFIVKAVTEHNGSSRTITLADIAAIEDAIVKTKAKLVVIDPLQSFIGAKVDIYRSNETRPIRRV